MKLSWTQPDTMADGSPFTRERFAGWTLSVDGKPAVAIPLQWDGDATRQYTFDLSLLELPEGTHTYQMWTTEVDGDMSAPSPLYTHVYKVAPLPPQSVSVS